MGHTVLPSVIAAIAETLCFCKAFHGTARCSTDVFSARAEVPRRKEERRFPLKTNKKTSKKNKMPFDTSPCVFALPGSLPAAPRPIRLNRPHGELNWFAFLPLFPAVARSQSLIRRTLPFAPTADVKSIPSQKTSPGSIPQHPQPAGGLRGLPDPAERGDFACSPPLPADCRASWTGRGARTGRGCAPQPCRAASLKRGAASLKNEEQQPLAPGDGLATDRRLRCSSLSQPHAWLELRWFLPAWG